MENQFVRCLRITLAYEGGWSDHPSDPGGATMKGVTIARYAAYKGRSVSKDELRAIGTVELEDIYRKGYWMPVFADKLPPGVDLCMFDYAVNSGPAKAIKDLQRIVGVTPDGQMGMMTLQALQGRGRIDLIHALCDQRLRFLKSLKTWGVFGKGWGNRVAAIRAKAISMATGHAPQPTPTKDVAPRANPADVKPTAKPNAKEKIAAGAGTAGGVIADAVEKLTPYQELAVTLKWVCLALVVAGIGVMLWRLFQKGE